MTNSRMQRGCVWGFVQTHHRFIPGRTSQAMRHAVRFLSGCLVSWTIIGGGVVEQSRPALGQEAGNPQKLFNGKDLTGWITPDDKSLFTVEDGEIVGRTKTKDDLK